MATTITYLLISGPDDAEAVKDHSVVAESDLTHRDTREPSPEQVSAVTFVQEHALEEETDLEGAARTLSTNFPETTVILCEVEERFDHVERLQTIVFMNGKHAGKVEHGYIFNVGQEG